MGHPDCSLYSLLLVVSGFWTHLFIYGVMYTPGVFYVVFLENLEYTRPPQVALGTALHSAVLYGVGPVSSVLITSYGCRRVGLVGGVISGAGLILTVVSRHVYNMCVMFGIVTGFGMGLAYMASTVIISRHFTRYRSVALAVANCAIGLGTLVYPLFLRSLLQYFDWRGSLMILGALTLNIVACAALYREPKTLSANKTNVVLGSSMMFKSSEFYSSLNQIENDDEDDVGDEPRVIPCTGFLGKVFADVHIFTHKGYVMLCFSLVLICIGLSVVYIHLAAFAGTRNIDADRSALLFSSIGGGNFIGQLLTGALHQLPWVTGFHTYIAGFTGVGIMLLVLPFVYDYIIMHLVAGVIGLGCGCFGISVLDIIVRLLGVDMVNGGFGYALLFMALGQAMGGPLAGIIYEATSIYSVSMYFGGALLVAGSSLMYVGLCKCCCPGTKPADIISSQVTVVAVP